MSKRGAVILPGSYDPVTVGHLEIIREAARLYERVFVVAFINPEKRYTFTPDERVEMLRIATRELPSVTVDFSDGLVIDYMRERGISEILKGYRNDADLEYEKGMAGWNKKNGGVETRLLRCKDEFSSVSSSAVREALSQGRMPDGMLPPGVFEYILSHKG